MRGSVASMPAFPMRNMLLTWSNICGESVTLLYTDMGDEFEMKLTSPSGQRVFRRSLLDLVLQLVEVIDLEMPRYPSFFLDDVEEGWDTVVAHSLREMLDKKHAQVLGIACARIACFLKDQNSFAVCSRAARCACHFDKHLLMDPFVEGRCDFCGTEVVCSATSHEHFALAGRPAVFYSDAISSYTWLPCDNVFLCMGCSDDYCADWVLSDRDDRLTRLLRVY